MKPLLFSICLLLSLASIGQAKNTPAKSTAAPDPKKAEQLFNEFFSMNQGDTADLWKMPALGAQICDAAPKSKYCTYGVVWANIQSKNYKEAYALLETLLRNNAEWAEAYFLKGLYLVAIKDNTYIQEIQHCIELKPSLFQPIFFLASNLEEAGSFKLSLVYYNKLEQVNPKHKSLYYNRAHVKSELKDYMGAVADYTKALEKDPSHKRALFNRGHTYLLLEEYAKAEIDFNAFIKIDPNYAAAYYYRGGAKYYQNRIDEACVDMKMAVKLGDKSAEKFLPNCK
jgi:tetratricopeptide (TPR) repeat protein